MDIVAQTFDEKKERSPAYIIWRERVRGAFIKAGLPNIAQRWLDCADPSLFFSLTGEEEELPDGIMSANVCSSDPHHYAKTVVPTCQLRVCPDCAHRFTARLIDRYLPRFEEIDDNRERGFRFRHVVLTTPVSLLDKDIRSQRKKLYQAVLRTFYHLLGDGNLTAGKKRFSECGLLLADEFGSGGLKLHFHMVFYGPYLPQSDLSDSWSWATGGVASVVWINKITSNKGLSDALSEVVKYTTKLWKTDRHGQVKFINPDLVPVLHKVLEGTRRIRSYGLFYDLDVQDAGAVCPDCGAPIVRLARAEWELWYNTGFMPDEFQVALGRATLNLIIGNKSERAPPALEVSQLPLGI